MRREARDWRSRPAPCRRLRDPSVRELRARPWIRRRCVGLGPGAAAARTGGAPRSVPLAAGDGRPRHHARRSCRPRGADGPEQRSHRGPPRRPLLRRHADNRGRRAGARANRTPRVPGRVRAPGRPVGVRHAPRPRQRASTSCTGRADPTARPVVCRGGHRGAGGEASPAAHHHPAPGPDRPHRAAQPGRPVGTAHLCLVYEVGLCADGGAGAGRGLGLPRARGRSHGDGGGPTGRGRPAVRDRQPPTSSTRSRRRAGKPRP